MRPFQKPLEQIAQVLLNWDQAPEEVKVEGSSLVGTIRRGSLEAQIKDPLTQEWVKNYLVDNPPATLTDIFATSPLLYAWLMSRWNWTWLQKNNFQANIELTNEDLLWCIIHLFQLEISSPVKWNNFYERQKLRRQVLAESEINPFNMVFPRMFLKSQELLKEYNIQSIFTPHSQEDEVTFDEAEPLLSQPAFANLFGNDRQIHLNPSWLAPTRQALWEQSLTSHSCRLCNLSEAGEGVIICPYCEEGTVECDYCGGDGQTNCHNCDDGWGDSPGTIACYDCDGDGQVDCYNCDDGEVICDNCEGGGNVACDECGGEGEQEGKTCEECEGAGEKDCKECEGEGSETCDECEGSGQERCDECDGDGTMECDYCDGWGTQDCEECFEGQNACDYCGEEYIIGTCPAKQLHDLTGKSLGLMLMENMPETIVNDYLLKVGREVAGILTFESQPISLITSNSPRLGETVFIFIPSKGYLSCWLINKRNQNQISFGNPRPHSTQQHQVFQYLTTPSPFYFWNTNTEELNDMNSEGVIQNSRWEFTNIINITKFTNLQKRGLIKKGITDLLVVKGASLPSKTFNWPQALP